MEDMSATLRGLTIGCDTVYGWSAMPTGVYGSGEVRAADEPFPRRSGLIAGDDLLGGRLLTFPVRVHEVGVRTVSEPAVIALEAAFAPGPVDEWIDVRFRGEEFSYVGRPRGVTYSATREEFDAGVMTAECRFMATDPTRYSSEMASVLLALEAAADGFMLPAELPFVIGTAPGTSTGVAANVGTATVNWQARLTGPLTNPRLEHVDSGQFVRIAGSIAAGQTVVLDSATGAILLNGTSPRPSWFSPGSTWWALAPGNNTIRFSADGGTGTALVMWRSGWT